MEWRCVRSWDVYVLLIVIPVDAQKIHYVRLLVTSHQVLVQSVLLKNIMGSQGLFAWQVLWILHDICSLPWLLSQIFLKPRTLLLLLDSWGVLWFLSHWLVVKISRCFLVLIHLHFGGRPKSRLLLLFGLCSQGFTVVYKHAIGTLDLLRANLIDSTLIWGRVLTSLTLAPMLDDFLLNHLGCCLLGGVTWAIHF